MTLDTWLTAAVADAEQRQLPTLKPMLEGLAESLAQLRAADFNDTAAPRLANDGHTRPESNIHRATAGHATAPGILPLPPAPPAAAPRMPPPAPQRLTLAEFGRQLRAGQTTSAATVDACLAAIAAGSDLNAYILVMHEEARAHAEQADRELAAGHDRGPLHGAPISVKDLFDVRGIATTAASRVRMNDIASGDAAAVIHLRHAGAVIVGKTNLHEFAFGTTNEDTAFGAARHPLDPRRSPGGSSGGSAVSVAAGMALGSVGTDTGGSVRIPAAACGLVGLKPTVAELPTEGVVPLSATMDHVGPLAQTVADAWLLHQGLLGRAFSRPLTVSPLAGLRVGLPQAYFCDLLEPGVATGFTAALGALQSAGATVTRVDIAHSATIASVYLALVLAEAAAYHAATLEATPELYTAAVRLRLELARYLPAEDYRRALAGREILRREVDVVLSSHDVLILPTLPIVAPVIGAPTVAINGAAHPVRNLMLRLTQLFNITGHPAVTLPCGVDPQGLPIGLQIVGRRHETDVLMHVAAGIEAALSASQ